MFEQIFVRFLFLASIFRIFRSMERIYFQFFSFSHASFFLFFSFFSFSSHANHSPKTLLNHASTYKRRKILSLLNLILWWNNSVSRLIKKNVSWKFLRHTTLYSLQQRVHLVSTIFNFLIIPFQFIVSLT